MTTVWREVTSMLLINNRLVITLSCKHQYSFKRTLFRQRHFPKNARGVNVFRCLLCEREAGGGKGA